MSRSCVVFGSSWAQNVVPHDSVTHLVQRVGVGDLRPVFVRVKRSGSGATAREYLQIVESQREGARVRQRVIATLGRRDELVADGRLDALLSSLAKFSEWLRVVARVREDGLEAHTAREWVLAITRK